ncbi:MAG: hypothetical protein ACREIT_08550, partial [Tepidisphaeraceae bacterium]
MGHSGGLPMTTCLARAAAMTAVLAGAGWAHAAAFTWNSTTGTTWDDVSATGWNTGAAFPNAIDDTATISQNILANQIINLNVNAIIGSLTFGDTTSTQTWTIQDTGALGTAFTFD